MWKSTVALAVPLVTGTAVVTVALPETPANASTTPSLGSVVNGVVNGVTSSVPKLLSPSPSPSKSKSGSSPSLPTIKLPNLLPSSSPSPSPSPSQSSSPEPSGTEPSKSSKKPAQKKQSQPAPPATVQGESAPAASSPAGGLLPFLSPSSTSAPTITSQPGKSIGYALPIPASLVSGHPALIGEGAPAPKKAQAASPVTMSIPQGTPVNAVTAGTFRVVGSTIVLVGNDGATYTYKNVSASAKPGKTTAGTRLGTSRPGGMTFSVAVPDAKGLVDADEAMQAWSSGLTVNVRSLPSTIAAATAPTKNQVLVVGDSGSSVLAGTLAKALKGPLVAVHSLSFDRAAYGSSSALGQQIANSKNQLVVVALSKSTPAEAAALAKLLPHGHQMLWVVSSAKQAGSYDSVAASNPAFRTETLPSNLAPGQNLSQTPAPALPVTAAKVSSALGTNAATGAPVQTASSKSAQSSAATEASAAKAAQAEQQAAAKAQATAKALAEAPAPASNWAQVSQLAAGTMTATYATTAYRLYAIQSEANSVLSYAELQLGKAYQWGATGPNTFDCSGLVMDALAQSGLSSARTSQAQWTQTKAHTISANQLKPGDLLFFAGSDGTLQNPGHVGIYVGDGEFLDAPYTGANVRFDQLKSMKGFVGATDPYALASGVPGTAQLASAQLAGLAAPSALNSYQAFARQLTASTWGPSQFNFLYQLWNRESGWNPDALNPLSGAFGIPQSLPAGKMATAGMDWGTDPYTQIIWGIGYIQSAYGTPQAAWAHEERYGWY